MIIKIGRRLAVLMITIPFCHDKEGRSYNSNVDWEIIEPKSVSGVYLGIESQEDRSGGFQINSDMRSSLFDKSGQVIASPHASIVRRTIVNICLEEIRHELRVDSEITEFEWIDNLRELVGIANISLFK